MNFETQRSFVYKDYLPRGAVEIEINGSGMSD